MEFYTIRLFGLNLEVQCEIEKPNFGTFDTPGDNGSIDIQDVTFQGSSIYYMITEIMDWEEKICDEIRKQL